MYHEGSFLYTKALESEAFMSYTKYPVEVVSVVRNKKTLGINSFLSRACSEEAESPYKIYGKFSRFTISILDQTDTTRKSATGNIRVAEIADIERRTQYAFNKHMAVEQAQKNNLQANSSEDIAYTVKIANGKLKGKTPAEAINEGNGKILLQQRQFLIENLNKYPNNKLQIDAIERACVLYKEGKLKKETQSNASELETVTLYNAGMHPLIRKTRCDGKCFVYEILISWKVGANYPVNVSLINYYAKTVQREDGRLNVMEVDERSKIRLSFALTEAEWFNILNSLERNMKQFEILTAKIIFDDAQKTYRMQLQQSKEMRVVSENRNRQRVNQVQNRVNDDPPF